MDMNHFSLLLSVGIITLGAVTLVSLILFCCSKSVRLWFRSQDYFLPLKIISIITVIATSAVLTYQYVFATPVCELCWWQRIFMFPIEIIAIVSLILTIKKNEVVIAVSALIGFLFAAYHYYHHLRIIVFDKLPTLSCGTVGIVPSCSDNYVEVFGFVTIPGMATVAFLSILWLSFLAWDNRTHTS